MKAEWKKTPVLTQDGNDEPDEWMITIGSFTVFITRHEKQNKDRWSMFWELNLMHQATRTVLGSSDPEQSKTEAMAIFKSIFLKMIEEIDE